MTTKVLLVDNYDSFTYNLAQAFGALGAEVTVIRADDPALAAALDAGPDRLVISPGPGRPEVAGRSPALVREGPERGIPTLGVCLGLQCAAVAFGDQPPVNKLDGTDVDAAGRLGRQQHARLGRHLPGDDDLLLVAARKRSCRRRGARRPNVKFFY